MNKIRIAQILLIILLQFWKSDAQTKVAPNFLFILTDDQTYASIHALNNAEIHTPNMDRLSEQGISFTHAFNQGSWSGAVCVASRTMLITGQTIYNAPKNKSYLDKWAEGNVSEITEVILWPEVFSNAGYETFLTGKWHNSDHAALKGFNMAKSIGEGMYETFDKTGSNKPGYNRSSINDAWKPWDKQFTGHWSPTVKDIIYNENGEEIIGASYKANQHTSELYANNAINYLIAKKTEKPFFMFVAFNAPHDPRQSPKEYVDMYPPESIKIPKNYLPEHPFDQGDHIIRDEKLAPFPRTEEAVQLHRSEYYAIISHVDYEIGRILTALENSGKKENTYVILTSDHGLAVGSHGLMGKQSQYDHSVRMPLIIAGPGIEKGNVNNEMVYMQSIFATTCELANLKVPETVEFKSLNGMLKGDKQHGEEYIYGTYKDFQRMIRSKKYKLIVYPKANKIQLFDLEQDPNEISNIANDIKFQSVKTLLFEQLKIKQHELGDRLILQSLSQYN